MVSLAELCAAPDRLSELGEADVLIAAAGTTEVVMRESGKRRDATMVFAHETIQMMRAERAGQLDKLRGALDANAPLLPIRQRGESVWEYITLGRASTADLIIDDPAISNVHCHFEIDYVDGTISVQDVGSSNGTFINRNPIQPHQPMPLKSGDCIRFGQSIYYYVNHTTLDELVNGDGLG